MKRLSLTILIALVVGAGFSLKAQDSASRKVADWSFSATKTGEGQYLIEAKAAIQKGWRLFSTTMPDTLPNSRVTFDSSVSLEGIVEKGKLLQAIEPVFSNSSVRYFEGSADWQVSVRIKDASLSKVKGSLQFMAINGSTVEGPDSIPFKFIKDASGKLVEASAGLQEAGAGGAGIKLTTIDLSHPVNDCGGNGLDKDQGLVTIFILGFLGGLIALVTPCVFPMIPLTVSFFIKRSTDRKKGIGNAVLYGFFIFLIYVLLSVPFYFLPSGQESILNNISTNIWLNLVFFVVFVVFSLSFFGLFEITLPSSIANKADSKSSVGSIGGIFFMALTLAVVSFSCTGPILGSLLAGSLSSGGSAIKLTMGMGGFGLALGIPFALFALFPNWLNSMPKSGGWLTSVKIVLGFIELALAFKFFSNADLVEHWGILKRETFFGIWIIIGICLVSYLLGWLRFSHDAPPKKLGMIRIGLALVIGAFVLYLIPGLTNTAYANRKLISGIPPPLSYSLYGANRFKGKGVEPNVINDYNKALALGKSLHKPVLLDFTGWACVNCRKTEEEIWPDPEVKALIEKNYILVSLYVDDRKKLPDDEQFLYPLPDGQQKGIRTIGDKFQTMQSVNFNSASQPLYVLISPDQQLLNKPIGYTPDAAAYANWLKCGVEAFHKTAIVAQNVAK